MSDSMKTVLAVAMLLGVFSLCGLGVYRGEMSAAAAVATSMAALSSAGVLGQLFAPKAQ